MLYVKEVRGDIFKIIGANDCIILIIQIKEYLKQNLLKCSNGLIGSLETGKVLGISIPVLWNISQILEVSIDKFFESR